MSIAVAPNLCSRTCLSQNGILRQNLSRILFILGFPNPFAGAAWTRVEFFARAWAARKWEVTVLGTFTPTTLQKRGAARFGNVTLLNLIFSIGLTDPLVFCLNSAISFIALAFFLFLKKPNAAIVSVPTGDVGLGAMLACRLHGVKCVVDYRDEWEDYAANITDHRMMRQFYRKVREVATYLYSKSELVVAVTTNMMMSLKRRGISNSKLITNGADVQLFKPSNNRRMTRDLTIFYSGVVGSYYRLDIAVRALRRLINNDLKCIRLVVVGKGAVEGAVNEVLVLASQLGVLDKIDYKGVINDKSELAALIAEADVGLIPYDNDILWRNSVPAKFFEYCACGIPIIATTHEDSMIADLILNNNLGLISPPLDIEKLAQNMCKIYRDASFRVSAGQRARVLVEEKYDRNEIADRYMNLLESLLK